MILKIHYNIILWEWLYVQNGNAMKVLDVFWKSQKINIVDSFVKIVSPTGYQLTLLKTLKYEKFKGISE